MSEEGNAGQGSQEPSNGTPNDQHGGNEPSSKQDKSRSESQSRAPQGDGEPKASEDSTDWKSEARKHERRAKDNRAAADQAAADRDAAVQAREEAESRQQEVLDGIAKALGLKQDDAPPDAATLQQTVAERDAKVTELQQEVERLNDAEQVRQNTQDTTELELRLELAALRSAFRQGVNGDSLVDRRSFLSELSALDYGADTFSADVDAVVKKAMEADPSLRLTTTPTPSAVGIGARGVNAADLNVAPGNARLRAAYGTSS